MPRTFEGLPVNFLDAFLTTAPEAGRDPAVGALRGLEVWGFPTSAPAFDPANRAFVYQRYLARVYAYVRTRAGTAEDAADLTQQVFLKALDALPAYRQRGLPFAAWLFRIARNTAADHRRQRRTTIAWDLLPESVQSSDEAGPETALLRREALARLETALARLDPAKRELLALRFAAGLTARDIAAVVGKSEEAVRKQLSRTLGALKEYFDGGDWEA